MSELLYSQEAEEAVIGSVLINQDCYAEIAKYLKADSFYIVRHEKIWRALGAIHARSEAIDILSVIEELQQLKWLEDVGGGAYITKLINDTPTSLHADTYGHIVQRAAVRRRLKALGHKLTLATDKPDIDGEQLLAAVDKELRDISDGVFMDSPIVWRSEALADVVDFVDNEERAGAMPTILNPIECINGMGGFAQYLTGGKVMVIAAPSGGGKTTGVDAIINTLVDRGENVLLWGGEWSPEENARRMIQQRGGATMDQFFADEVARQQVNGTPLEAQPGRMSRATIDTTVDIASQLAYRMRTGQKGDVAEYNNPGESISKMISGMETFLKRSARDGKAIRVVVWDYIQLVKIDDDVKARNEAEYAFGLFKQMCVTNRVIGIMTSQVNKGAGDGGELKASDMHFIRPDKTNITVMMERVSYKDDISDYMRLGVVKNSLGQQGSVNIKADMLHKLLIDFRASNIVKPSEVREWIEGKKQDEKDAKDAAKKAEEQAGMRIQL